MRLRLRPPLVAMLAALLAPIAAAAPPAPPSLLLPGVVDPSAGPLADRPLAEVVEECGRSVSLDRPRLRTPPRRDAVASDEATRAEAMRRYVEGRAALAEGRVLIAVRAFEEAEALDPAAPEIVSGLARAYARAGNPLRAAEYFALLLDRDPGDGEALATLGMRAAEAGDHRAAAHLLGRLHLLEPDRRARGLSVFRAGAETAAALALARSLRELNADRALLEVLSRALAEADPTLVSLPIAEARRALGDAHARRGELDAALEAWTAVPASAWERGLVEPRAAWALVALGRDVDAVDRMRRRVEARWPERVADGREAIDDEEIALVGWLGSVLDDPAPLRAWGARLASGEPEGAPFSRARLAAALLPTEGATLLRAALDAGAADPRILRECLAALAEGDAAAPIAEAALRLSRAGVDEDAVIGALLASGLDAPTILAEAAALPSDAASVALRARLHAAMGDAGEAWRIAEAGLAAGLDADLVRGAALDAAGRLAEPSLVRAIESRIDASDAEELLRLALAWRRCDEFRRAERAARAAVERAPPQRLGAALHAAAQIVGERAARGADRALALDAVALARSAVEAEPGPRGEESRRLLIGLLDAMAAGQNEPEREAFRAEARRVREASLAELPDSRLARQIDVERMLGDGAVVDAMHALAAAVVADPGDVASLRTLTAVLDRSGRGDIALARLDERLATTPADPAAWQLWTEATIASGRAEEAIARLEDQAQRDPGNPIVEPLRELALRAAGRGAEADEVAAARIARLPPSPRRDLEHAARRLAAGAIADAVPALERAADRSADLGARDALGGAELAQRLPGSEPSRNALLGRFAQAALDAAASDPDEGGATVARAAALAVVALPDGPQSEQLRRELVARAAASLDRGFGPNELGAWIANAQTFADLERSAEGSDFLSAALRSERRLDAGLAARLARAVFALDAHAGGRSEHAIALFDLLRSRGVRPLAPADARPERAGDGLLALSGLFAIVGDRDGSIAILEEALRRDPEHPMVRNNLGWDRLERGLLDDRTVALVEGAFAAEPEDAAIIDSLGWLRYRQGMLRDADDAPGAATLLARAVARGGSEPSPETLDHLGDALWRLGDMAGAIGAWQRAEREIEARFPRERTIRALHAYERREHGVRVADAEAWWARSYGEILDRVRAKLASAARGDPPPIAEAP